jgi:hypothetical protein
VLSLFAFTATGVTLKVGVPAGSVIAAALGVLVLVSSPPPRTPAKVAA